MSVTCNLLLRLSLLLFLGGIGESRASVTTGDAVEEGVDVGVGASPLVTCPIPLLPSPPRAGRGGRKRRGGDGGKGNGRQERMASQQWMAMAAAPARHAPHS